MEARQMVSSVTRLTALMLAVAALGCGSGLSQDAATTRCDQERAGNQCVDANAYDACISCYEECGDKCRPVPNACPAQFACQ
jgi:hypothetical protein